MKNIFYFDNINKIGGVETFFFEIAKKYFKYDITIFYSTGDEKQIQRLKKYVRIKQYINQKIKCKKAFFNYSLLPIDNIEAEEYYEIIHADYKALNKKPNTHPKITTYIGVSQSVCDSFTESTGLPCQLCYNPITIEKPKKVLKLLSATRLTKEKGKGRIEKMAEMLDQAGIPYLGTIFTNDTKVINNPNIIYMEPRLDIRNYIAASDYVVQLSDTEAYCYTMIESLLLGVPIIVTPGKCLKELEIDERYGFILPFDMNNVPIEDIYNKTFNFVYTNKEDRGDKILDNTESTYLDEMNSLYEVQATSRYKEQNRKDAELNRIPTPGERGFVTKERLDVLLGENKTKDTYVKLIRKIKKEA